MLPQCAVATGYEKLDCKRPHTAYRVRSGKNSSGTWPITFNINNGYIDLPVKVPCGRCIGCKLATSRMWAVRCMHEAFTQREAGKQNCFLTLTFSKKHLSESGSIETRIIQLFIKRLRKKHGNGIKFFQCGEYGDKNRRPHYHVLLFGFDFKDKVFWKNSNGIPLYRSPGLEKLWPYGYSTIGDVNFQSAAYVARYITKKITGDCLTDKKSKWYRHYENIDKETGVVYDLVPEKISMSNGIGRKYYNKYKNDMYSIDAVAFRRGNKIVNTKIPRYYDDLHSYLDGHGGLDMGHIKIQRKIKGEENKDDNTDDRLAVRENIETERAKLLIRSYENENIQLER